MGSWNLLVLYLAKETHRNKAEDFFEIMASVLRCKLDLGGISV